MLVNMSVPPQFRVHMTTFEELKLFFTYTAQAPGTPPVVPRDVTGQLLGPSKSGKSAAVVAASEVCSLLLTAAVKQTELDAGVRLLHEMKLPLPLTVKELLQPMYLGAVGELIVGRMLNKAIDFLKV